MGSPKCISCRTTNILLDQHEIDYASCKLADGKPCTPCLEGIELSALISQTRETLENLLSRRRNLSKEVNGRHDSILRNLPTEVSAHIFLFALSEDLPKSILDSNNLNPSKGQVIMTPFLLGAVCRAWRTIAWASPYLWTKISIPVKATAHLKYLNIADDWLKRSGTLPLSIHIYAPRAASPPMDLLGRLSGVIERYLHRCCHLEFSGRIQHLPIISGEAPLLDYIKINSDVERTGIKSKINLQSTKPEGVRLCVEGHSMQLLQLLHSNINSLEGSHIAPASIRNFVVRSGGGNLRCLHLNTLACQGELCELLLFTNFLEELHLVEHNVKTIQAEDLFSAFADMNFLPNLSTFSVKIRDEGFPWHLAIQIFGPLDGIHPLMRPMKHFQVIYDWCLGLSDNARTVTSLIELDPSTLFLSKEVTQRFLDVAREGVNIDLQDLYTKEDIFMLAMEYHNIDIPEWYQIKSFVGISELDGLDFDYDSSTTDDSTEGSDDLEREAEDFSSNSDVDTERSESDEEEDEYRQFLLGCL